MLSFSLVDEPLDSFKPHTSRHPMKLFKSLNLHGMYFYPSWELLIAPKVWFHINGCFINKICIGNNDWAKWQDSGEWSCWYHLWQFSAMLIEEQKVSINENMLMKRYHVAVQPWLKDLACAEFRTFNHWPKFTETFFY